MRCRSAAKDRDDGGGAVRQNVIEDDARIACARPRAGLNEFAAAERHEFPAHESRDVGQETAAIAMDRARDEGERIATVNRAKMKAGMVWKNSVMSSARAFGCARDNIRRPSGHRA